MTSVVEIKAKILANLEKSMPEFLWKTGEPLVDILDSVAEFHYRRGIVENLTRSLQTPEGFRRLIYDVDFRLQLSSVLGLSLIQRTRTWVGVPSVVSNDFDAFVWYYLDRFGENRGFKRSGGQIATGTCELWYPAAVGATETASVIFKSGSQIYRMDATLDGPIDPPASGTRKITGVIYALGYGSRYNVPQNTLQMDSVISTAVSIGDLSFLQYAIGGGSDYESNEKFLARLIDATMAVSGLGTRANVASVLASVSGIDKYLVKGTAAYRRFKASTDIYIKSGAREVWTVEQKIGDDGKVLVRYQPADVIVVNDNSVSPVVKISPTEYEIQTVTGEYMNSVRQIMYLDFATAISNGTIAVGDTVQLKLLVNTACVDVYRQLNYYYSRFYEYVRDINVYQTVDRAVSIDMTAKLKSIVDPDVASQLISDAVLAFINNIPIEADLDYSDIINAVYGIYYGTDVLVDSVDAMTITTEDSTGTTYTLSAPGTLSLDDGETWAAATPTIEVV